MDENDLLQRIKRRVVAGQYRIKIHAVRHMIDEGFTEARICEAIAGPCTLLEHYPLERRCLIGGRFYVGKSERQSVAYCV